MSSLSRHCYAAQSGQSCAYSCDQIHSARAGFTLVELLVVLGVIIALSGISITTYSTMAESGRVRSSQLTIDALTAALAAYGQDSLSLPSSPAERSAGLVCAGRPLGDLDGGGVLDGLPGRDPDLAAALAGGEASLLAARGSSGTTLNDLAQHLGYRGVWSLGIDLTGRQVDETTGRVIDSWGRPLRIGFGARFGSAGFGIWSLGSDGVDQFGAGDDLTSWGDDA
ncbi:MAG: prepilin-type N-terminal cleavage/methylation domain-containing protein [Planctomycetota bacterium]|jgi:prepilin-type N-terminal cleavage/methylation domain-containing protein|nr:prepilin-type N-terminal cleavage/methylation domain-containing protein [Planctomycetota bacterium]